MTSRNGKKRREAGRAVATEATAPRDDTTALGELIRRLVLGMAAALVVARAYWPAEGTSELATGQQLAWTFALLGIAALAVMGAMLSGSLRLRVSWADAAIVGLIAAVGMSASEGLDRRVAINLAWQWAGIGLIFILLRNLPRTRGESRAMAGILAATATAVSVYALYQVGVELPELRRQFQENPGRLLAMVGITTGPGSPEYEQFASRLLHANQPYGTFALANSLAGYIVGPLVLGIGVLLAGIGRRGRGADDHAGPRPTWAALPMAALPVLVLLAVLLLSESRSASLGLAIGGMILVATMASRFGSRAVIGGTVALLVVFAAAAGGLWWLGLLDREMLTLASRSLSYRFEYWVGTWRLLFEGNTWLTGLGPGNFRTAYRRHKLVEASEDIADPHNLFLEVWAVAGIAALVLLVAGLGLVLWNVFRPLRKSDDQPSPAAAPDGLGRPGTLLLWAGIGGWMGVLVFGDLNVLADDNESLVRWVILGLGWGLAVALAGPLWSRVELPSLAIGAAIVAMVVNLLAAGGIGYASVASMLWGLAAIGLNLRDDRPAGRPREMRGLFPPFVAAAVLAAVIGTFFGTVSPYWRSQALMNQADAILADRSTMPRQEDLDRVSALLVRAIEADRYSTRPYLALAELELLAWLSRGSPPEDAVWNRIVEILEDALTPPRNPRSLEVRVARINIARRIMATRPDLPSVALERLRTIIMTDSYVIATQLAPTSALEHARAADALAAVGQYARAARVGKIALELDARTPHIDKMLPELMRNRFRASIPDWQRLADTDRDEDSGEEPQDRNPGSEPSPE